jgi:hypothetical protein
VIRFPAGDGTYLVLELLPRREAHVYDSKSRIVARNVEASCKIATGPARHPIMTFEPRYLAELGWAFLTASHRLLRLQGGATLAELGDDPQLTIYDALEAVRR